MTNLESQATFRTLGLTWEEGRGTRGRGQRGSDRRQESVGLEGETTRAKMPRSTSAIHENKI